MDIVKLLKKYPNLYLYYHDNGQWILYSQKPPKNTYVGEAEHDKFIITEGEDHDCHLGYAPSLVVNLCKALGIKVDSI